MNDKLKSRLLLAFVLILSLPIVGYSNNANYKAQVTAHAMPTGKGKVYVPQGTESRPADGSSQWVETSVGGNGSNTSGGNVNVNLYAKPNDGYAFDGWYNGQDKTDLQGSNLSFVKEYRVGTWSLFGGNDTSTYDIYAFFSPIEYTVTYNPDGGSVAGGASQGYNIESTAALRSATKVGSNFTGWKVTAADGNWALNTLHPEGESLTGKYGNVTLTAQWDALACDIVISVSGLLPSESAIFNVSKGGSVLYTVAVQSGSSVTIKDQEVGQYTVSPASWSWAYNISPASLTQTLTYPNTNFEFSATASGSSKKHDEQYNVNWGL